MTTLKDEIQYNIHTISVKSQKDAATMAAQVQHLTDTVDATTTQVSTNLDFAVDAMQQIRDELNGRIDALAKQVSAPNPSGDAPNPGGDGHPGSATDVPLVTQVVQTKQM